MTCKFERSDCSTATDLLNFVRPIIAVSKLSTLRLHFAHLRFAELSSSFNIISNRALIVDASLSCLSFFTNQYCRVAISHRGSSKAAHRCYFH